MENWLFPNLCVKFFFIFYELKLFSCLLFFKQPRPPPAKKKLVFFSILIIFTHFYTFLFSAFSFVMSCQLQFFCVFLRPISTLIYRLTFLQLRVIVVLSMKLHTLNVYFVPNSILASHGSHTYDAKEARKNGRVFYHSGKHLDLSAIFKGCNSQLSPKMDYSFRV